MAERTDGRKDVNTVYPKHSLRGYIQLLLSFSIRVAKRQPVWEITVHSVNCTCLSRANFVEFHQLVYKIILSTRVCHINPSVTLKMKSRSLKPNQLLSFSQQIWWNSIYWFKSYRWYKNLSRRRRHGRRLQREPY